MSSWTDANIEGAVECLASCLKGLIEQKPLWLPTPRRYGNMKLLEHLNQLTVVLVAVKRLPKYGPRASGSC